MISSYPRSFALAAANSPSVSAPFWCSAANASSSDEIPCGAGAARESEAQDVRDGGVDVARRLGAEEGAHDEAVRLRPPRREREGECQGLGHHCFIGVSGSRKPIVSSVASGQLRARAEARNPISGASAS